MCRSIKILRQPSQTATAEEIQAAALQFVRKISGSRKPSRADQPAFSQAVEEIALASARLLQTMTPRRSVPGGPGKIELGKLGAGGGGPEQSETSESHQ